MDLLWRASSSHRFRSLFLPSISLGNIIQSDKLQLWKIRGGKMLRVHFIRTLKLGWAKQRATAIIEAVRGPDTPMVVKNSEMFGVSLNGTGRLASRSPVASLISKRKYETLSFPVSCWEMIGVKTNPVQTANLTLSFRNTNLLANVPETLRMRISCGAKSFVCFQWREGDQIWEKSLFAHVGPDGPTSDNS